jgi:hypothetical protein
MRQPGPSGLEEGGGEPVNGFYCLLPLKRDVIHWDEIVNRLGYQPELTPLRKFLARLLPTA